MIGFRINIHPPGQFEKLSAKLNNFERKQVVHQTTVEVTQFLKGKMQEYPPEKRVTRKQAYGQTFFSDKQRRWFFAALQIGRVDAALPADEHAQGRLDYRAAWQGWHGALQRNTLL